MRRDQVLTHFYHTTERSLPLTMVFLTSKKDLKEQEHVITGHLELNQLVALLECAYTAPEFSNGEPVDN